MKLCTELRSLFCYLPACLMSGGAEACVLTRLIVAQVHIRAMAVARTRVSKGAMAGRQSRRAHLTVGHLSTEGRATLEDKVDPYTLLAYTVWHVQVPILPALAIMVLATDSCAVPCVL